MSFFSDLIGTGISTQLFGTLGGELLGAGSALRDITGSLGDVNVGDIFGQDLRQKYIERGFGEADKWTNRLLGERGNLFNQIAPFNPYQFNYNTSGLRNQAEFGQGIFNPLAAEQAGASSEQLQQARQFDVMGRAEDITGKLSQLALPSEQRAASQLTGQLFSQGRLGASGGAAQMGALQQAQEQAATGRALQGYETARSEQQQLFNQALGLGQGAAGMFNVGLGGQQAATTADAQRQNLLGQLSLGGRGQDIGMDQSRLQYLLSTAQLGMSPYIAAMGGNTYEKGLLDYLGQAGGLFGGFMGAMA